MEIADGCQGYFSEMNYQPVSITIWEILKYGILKQTFISVEKIDL